MIDAYKNLFSEAVNRTMQMNVDAAINHLVLENKKKKTYFTKENKEGVLKHLFRCVNEINAEYLINNPVDLNLGFKAYLEDYLNCPVILTIGGVYFKGKEIFRFKEGDIINLKSKNSFEYEKINPHVWFTLPSLEIIDLTFLEQYNCKRGLSFRYQKEFEYIFDSINNIYFYEEITYMPTLVGIESLVKMDLLKPGKYEKIVI